MPINLKDVDHVAMLARLELTEAEKEAYTRQLNDILGYMERLNALDTSQVEPTAHVLPLSNVFREDRQRDGLSNEEALQNAPEQLNGMFKVPRVIG